MKNSLLLIALFLSGSIFSQYYYIPHFGEGKNPGGLNTDNEVIVGNGPPAGWTSIHPGNAASPVWTAAITIPFTFLFDGTPVSTYKVSTSGVLSFASTVGTAPSYTNAALPSSSVPAKSVCVWGLSGTQGNDAISYKTFGTAPNRQYWIQFSSYSFPEGPASAFTYWSIVLEETTNKIYVVDMRYVYSNPKLTIGVQTTTSSAVQVYGSPNVQSVTLGDVSGTDNAYYEFIPGTQPAFDLAVTSLTVGEFLSSSAAPFSITGTIDNRGSSKITSMKVNYSVNGAAPVSGSLSSLSIAAYQTYTFTCPSKWTPSGNGTYTIKVWASDLNGSNADINNINDTLTYYLNVGAAVKQRLPLHEEFTSSTCGPCASANASLQPMLDANASKCAVIKYQVNWPGAGDPYYTAEVGARKSYYGVPAVPYMRVDGTSVISDPGSYSSSSLLSHYAIPSYMQISGYYNVTGTTVTVEATVNPSGSFNSNNLILHIAVIENETHNNIGTNGETKFEHVMKKMLDDDKGTSVTLRNGVPVVVSKSYTFPAGNTVEEFTDLNAVVFVQDKITQEVYQSAYLKYSPTGIDVNNISSEEFVMYPNPAKDNVTLNYMLDKDAEVQIQIFNELGSLVYSSLFEKKPEGIVEQTFNTSMLPSGVYLLKLNAGLHSMNKQLVIVR